MESSNTPETKLEESRRKLKEAFDALPKETQDAIRTTVRSPEFKAKIEKDVVVICKTMGRLSDVLKSIQKDGLEATLKSISWFCNSCKVEVYQTRCKICGKTKREKR